MPMTLTPQPNALSTLQRLKSLTNVGAQSNRGLDIATGADVFGPTDSELEDQQNADADKGEATTGYGFSDSKDNLREDAMAKVRRSLAQADVASRARIAEASAPKQVEGEYGLAKTRLEQVGNPALRASETAKNTAEAGQADAGRSLTQRLMAQGSGSGDTGVTLGGTEMQPRIDAQGRASYSPAPEHKPTAQGSQALLGLNEFTKVGPQILARLEAQNPGIAKDPSKYGGITDAVTAKLKGLAYRTGMVAPPANNLNQDELSQLEGLAKVLGARPYMQGRPNQRIYEDIISHLPDMGNSPGANYSRIQQLLRLAPDLEQAISEVEDPGYVADIRNRSKANAAGQSDPYGLR